MPFDPEKLPGRAWLAAGSITLAVTALALWFLWPRLISAPANGPGGNPASIGQSQSGDAPADIELDQTTESGQAIPWGRMSDGGTVRLAVSGLGSGWHGVIQFSLQQEGATVQHVEGERTQCIFRRLLPGRYRWSALVTADGGGPVALQPPRETEQSFDFIVPSRQLALSGLEETHFDGTPIGDDLATTGGALLSASATPVPAAVVEFEVKPAQTDFDGTGVRPAPVNGDGHATVFFENVEGDYHWRARATAPGFESSAWVALRRTPRVDFHIVASEDRHLPMKHEADDATLPEGVSSTAGSGGGSGPSQPLTSEPIVLPSFLSLLLTRWSVAAAALFAILTVIRWLRARKRKAGKP